MVEVGIAEQNLVGVAAGLGFMRQKSICSFTGLFFNSKGIGTNKK